MGPWFEKCPERLDAELRALTDGSFEVEIDTDARAKGTLKLTVKCAIEGVVHDLIVVFPSGYPFFAFQVFAPSLDLDRHQDPVSKLLCFTRRIETEWKSSDTVAQYLLERLPLILEANKSAVAYSKEEQFGAPITGYLPFHPGTLMLTGDWSVPADVSGGALLLGIEPNSNANAQLRGAVLKVLDAKNKPIAEAESQIAKRYEQKIHARWIRLPTKPKVTNAEELLERVTALSADLRAPKPNSNGPDVIGVVFPDEVHYRELHDTWLFIVRAKERYLVPKTNGRQPPGERYGIYLARPDRAGRTDLQARVPRVRPLQHKKVAVVGIGALGSPAAWQLARAGVGKITLVDADFVNSGTSPRWMLGIPAAGFPKTGALKSLIEHNYPYVEVEEVGWRVGHPAFNEAVEKNVESTFGGSDLVLDCTAEFTIHHYLSDIAWERRVPYLWCSGTDGGWGGVVGRSIRGVTSGCWKCFRQFLFDGSIAGPSAEQSEQIQPVGCFSPTFAGTGFDMDLISTMGARLAVATLCHAHEGGYPNFDWDVGVVDLWEGGKPIAPKWRTHVLKRHDDCDCS